MKLSPSTILAIGIAIGYIVAKLRSKPIVKSEEKDKGFDLTIYSNNKVPETFSIVELCDKAFRCVNSEKTKLN